jgi:imidazolonepropionase
VIIAAGSRKEVEGSLSTEGAHRIDATGKVVAPGFVDCHTHLVFGGSRVDEYSVKLVTDDPAELARRGIPTGIMVSVEKTRKTPDEELFRQAAGRLEEMILSGTTTVESKSGYGLDTETELRMLRTNRRLGNEYPVEVVSTFLGAHGWPSDVAKEDYMKILVEEMIPAVTEENLAEFCDIWCDEGHYTVEESRIILQAGRDAGLEPKIHTGAYSYIGGADLAAEMRMASADHLNYTPVKALKSLAKVGVPGVLLPGIDFAVRHPNPFDPRPMVGEKMTLALATNCCPGCWCTSMPLTLQLGCRNHGLSPEQVIRAATIGSASALRRERETGSLEKGKRADIQIWNLERYEDALYHLGSPFVNTVIQNGRIAVRDGRPQWERQKRDQEHTGR